MANGSVLSNGQSHERNFDFKRGGPEEEPKPDVARLAALAQHLNPETDASDQANGSVRKHPPEPIGPTIDGSGREGQTFIWSANIPQRRTLFHCRSDRRRRHIRMAVPRGRSKADGEGSGSVAGVAVPSLNREVPFRNSGA